MFERVLPQHIDNRFTGQKSAGWLLVLILSVKTAQGLAVLFGGASVLGSADGIPLDTYTPPAAQTIVSVWAILGFTRLLICLLGLLVLLRYRSMLPFMFGLLLLQDVGRDLVFHFIPILRVGTPPGPTVNLGLVVLTVVGLALSLWPRRYLPAQSV